MDTLLKTRDKMRAMKVTEVALSKRLGISQGSISATLNGRTYCSVKQAERFSKAVDEMIAEAAPKPLPPSKHRHDTASRRASQDALLEEWRKNVAPGEHGEPGIWSFR